MEKAKASTAVNNLFTIYSAEQNYKNNSGAYCLGTAGTCDNLADIDLTLSLNIPDDGNFTYSCNLGATGIPTCTAARTNPLNAVVITLTLNSATQPNNGNPVCASGSNWCP